MAFEVDEHVGVAPEFAITAVAGDFEGEVDLFVLMGVIRLVRWWSWWRVSLRGFVRCRRRAIYHSRGDGIARCWMKSQYELVY